MRGCGCEIWGGSWRNDGDEQIKRKNKKKREKERDREWEVAVPFRLHFQLIPAFCFVREANTLSNTSQDCSHFNKTDVSFRWSYGGLKARSLIAFDCQQKKILLICCVRFSETFKHRWIKTVLHFPALKIIHILNCIFVRRIQELPLTT